MDLVNYLKRPILLHVVPFTYSDRWESLLWAMARNFPGYPDFALDVTLQCELLPDSLKNWLASKFGGWRKLNCYKWRRPPPPPWWLWPYCPGNRFYSVSLQDGHRYHFSHLGSHFGMDAVMCAKHNQIAILSRPIARDEDIAFAGLGIDVGGWRLRWRLPFGLPYDEVVIQLVNPKTSKGYGK